MQNFGFLLKSSKQEGSSRLDLKSCETDMILNKWSLKAAAVPWANGL